MAHGTTASTETTANGKYYFLVRRLHSLTGLVPLGVFLFMHLLTNASILAPAEVPGGQFQEAVNRIHSLPGLKAVEVFGILIPLAFHTVIGIQIAKTSKPNTTHYPYGPNVRYAFQRLSAWIALVFLLFHLWHMHWVGGFLGGAKFDHTQAARTTAEAIQAAWWIGAIYFVGITASVYHLANGIWTSLITWGITIQPRSQKIAGYMCAVFGVVLGALGIGALFGFQRFDVNGTRGGQDQVQAIVAPHENPG